MPNRKQIFHGILTHDGETARLEIPDKHLVAQKTWEKLGGTFEQVDGKMVGRMRVLISIIEDQQGPPQTLRGWFHKVLLPSITDAANEFGNEYNKEQVYEILKGMYAKWDVSGTRATTVGMSNKEYREFVDRCQRFAHETLGMKTLPDRRFPEQD